jgi:uncharacterized protein (TIGR03435 family)
VSEWSAWEGTQLKRIRVVLAAVLLPCFGAPAQSGGGQPAFELASVRPARPGRSGGPPHFAITPGRLTFQNTSLRRIVEVAYGVEDYRLQGPDWIESERYDIVAKAPASVRLQAEMMIRLKALLSERFQLQVHHESKELEVYALIVSKQGMKLQAAKPSEAVGKGREDEGHIHFESLSMRQLAAILSTLLKQPVVDQTNVEGNYAVWLDWSPGHADASAGAPAPGAALFVALNEQLGLGLQMRKAPQDVLVIDRVERPAMEN